MRSPTSSPRTQRSGRRVRYANEHRKRPGRSRRPSIPPPFKLTKDGLSNFYFMVIVGPVLLVIAGFVAFFAHDVVLPGMFMFVTNSATDGIYQMLSRPTLIIAFLFVLSLVWIFSDGDSSGSSANFRRGRDVGGLNRAQKLAKDYSRKSRRSPIQRRR